MNDVTQNGTTSGGGTDFGFNEPSEVRFIGCNDTANWMGSNNLLIGSSVPSGQNLIRFLTNQTNYTSTKN